MFLLRRCISPLCVVVLIACASDPGRGDPVSPIKSVGRLALEESGPSASGAGVIIQEPSGAMRTFSFHARVMPDGSVQGEYDNHNRQGGFVNHGDINCLRFVGPNGAVMSGVATRSTNPLAPPGTVTIFRVEDIGEGADNAADRVSQLLIFPVGSTQTCETFTPATTLPVVGGNVQVQP